MRTKGPRYTPVSKRQDKPDGVAWLIRNHPELSDGQIGKLIGTTRTTIQALRERTHWNIANIQPKDPVTLGLTSQRELDAAVAKAAKAAGAEAPRDDPARQGPRGADRGAARRARGRMPARPRRRSPRKPARRRPMPSRMPKPSSRAEVAATPDASLAPEAPLFAPGPDLSARPHRAGSGRGDPARRRDRLDPLAGAGLAQPYQPVDPRRRRRRRPGRQRPQHARRARGLGGACSPARSPGGRSPG